MRKIYSFLGAMACVAASATAQSLPNAVWTCDFEGVSTVADIAGAEMLGKGEFRKSTLDNFGTYYLNNPLGEGSYHNNYLLIKTSAFVDCYAKSNETLSIAFWLNASESEKQTYPGTYGAYWSCNFSAYSSANSYKTWSWPMMSARDRGTLQINCNGWSDYTPEENVLGVNAESTAWHVTKMVDSGEVDTDGNPVMVPSDFDANWHYVVFTFNGLNAKYYADGVLLNEWNATNNNYSFPSVMNALDLVCLGDGGPFWNDASPTFAYDDISIYSTVLEPDQMELIMNIKNGNIGDDERLAIAKSQLELAINEASNFQGDVSDAGFTTLAGDFGDYIMEIDPENYTSVEDINKAIADITAEQAKVNDVVNAYKVAIKEIELDEIFCNETVYAGAEAFSEAISSAKSAISDPTSTSTINSAMEALDVAKADYLFTQVIPEDGKGIDVTKMIQHPWFCQPDAEPTVSETEGINYTVSAPGDYLTSAGWTFYTTLTANKDLTTYYTNGLTTANLFHDSTVSGAVLDIHQAIKNLKPGYYSVSALISSTSAPTDDHLYATADGVTKVSATSTISTWDGKDAWETLTTDKVRVGEDGTLTIGATATTDGTQYKGWFCVTNFQLTYYGTDIDLAEDVKAKSEEAENIIAELILAGDKSKANSGYETIKSSSDSDYDKVSQLTDLIKAVKECVATEKAFTAYEDISNKASDAEDPDVKTIYKNGAKDIYDALVADDATVDILPGLNTLYASYVSYVSKVEAAKAWGTTAVTAEVNSQVASISGATAESLDANKAKLIDIMKSSISEFAASESNPKDITGIVANPSFDGDSDAGWTIDADHANWYSECEFFERRFNIYQTISGLPAGSYRIEVQGFYRDGGRDEAVNHYNAINEETGENLFIANASLYANTVTSPLMSLGASYVVGDVPTTHADGSTYAWYQPNPDAELTELVSYPDGMNAVQYCFDNGKYAGNYVNVVIAEGEDLTFGISKSSTIAYDWVIFDNFKLFYLGTDAPTGIGCIPGITGNATAVEYYTLGGIRVAAPVKGVNLVKMSDGTVKKVIK